MNTGGWQRIAICGIRATGISDDHRRRDCPGRGRWHNQERWTRTARVLMEPILEKGDMEKDGEKK